MYKFNKFETLTVVVRSFKEQFSRMYVEGWEPKELSDEDVSKFASILQIPDPINKKEVAIWIDVQLNATLLEMDKLEEYFCDFPDYDWSGWVKPFEQLVKALTEILYK